MLTWLDEEGGPREEGGAVYTSACDMWSAGVTAYAMLTGDVAYELPEDGGGAAVCKAVRAAKPSYSSPVWRGAGGTLCTLVKACLRNLNPEPWP